jgi:hypothetical protein
VVIQKEEKGVNAYHLHIKMIDKRRAMSEKKNYVFIFIHTINENK